MDSPVRIDIEVSATTSLSHVQRVFSDAEELRAIMSECIEDVIDSYISDYEININNVIIRGFGDNV